MLLACRELKISFDAVPVLTGGYFHLEEKEKAAIVGTNGAGKSTLLNLISGRLSPEDGSVTLQKGATFGYLTQHQGLESSATIYDELASARASVMISSALRLALMRMLPSCPLILSYMSSL